MVKVIKDKTITESAFAIAPADTASADASNTILPLPVFLENQESLKGRNDIGVWLEAGEDVEDLEAFVHELPVIALHFPAFGDGRAYSSANILRRKFGYQGEIRAFGDVRRDQLEQMVRCGFDTFEMAEGQDWDKALLGLDGFTYNYQGAIDRPEPLFRKR